MKQLFLIIALIITFSSVGKDEDTIKITFNKQTFKKAIPKTYDKAVETIKIMETLFNSFDSTYNILDSSYTVLKITSDTLTNEIVSYIEKNDKLVKEIDSLNSIILKNTDSIKDKTDVYSDSLKNLVKEEKSVFKIGFSTGFSSSIEKDKFYCDYIISPLLMYDKFFTMINLGVYSINNDDFIKKIGCNLGIMLSN